MKIMLSNAPWHIEKDEKFWLGIRAGSRWPFLKESHGAMTDIYRPFPFFLATASALLKKDGFDVILRDSIVTGERYSEFFSFVLKEKPDVLMLETATPSISNDIRIAGRIKEYLPDTKIVFAGIHTPITESDFLRDNPEVDFAIYGEYEHPLLLLMRSIRDGKPFSDVPNIVYRNENSSTVKNEREPLIPMDELPWPDRDALPDTYYDGCCGMPGKELQIHTSRGCPFRCNFCAWPQFMYDHKYRVRDPQDVIEELKENFQKSDYTHFYIDDDTVNVSKDHFITLCRLIKESGFDRYPWGCMGRADLMDDEMIEAMRDAGCYSIKYGVESFDQGILDRTGKSMNVEKNVEYIRKTREAGIRVHLTYCLGLLGDTKETIEDTIEKALALSADERQFSIATPYPGSELWKEFEAKGLLTTEDFSKFDGNNIAVASQDGLPAEELVRLRDEAETRSMEQLANTVPAVFLTEGFKKAFISLLSGRRKIVITSTMQRSLVKALRRYSEEAGVEAYILTHERFVKEYDDVPEDRLIRFSIPVSFDADEMKKLISDIKADGFDGAVIPCRVFDNRGMENVINVCSGFTDHIVMVHGNGGTELWEKN